MKHIFFTLFVLTLFSSFSSTAQDINLSIAVTTSFNASFKNAQEVQWSQSGPHYKAEFYMNGQYVTAFYDKQATFLGITKNISPLQLPVTLQTRLKESYEDYWISDLFEKSGNHGTSYYVTIENNDAKIILKSIVGQWSVYKKNRKS